MKQFNRSAAVRAGLYWNCQTFMASVYPNVQLYIQSHIRFQGQSSVLLAHYPPLCTHTSPPAVAQCEARHASRRPLGRCCNVADAMVLRGQKWTGTAGGPVAGRHGHATRHCSARLPRNERSAAFLQRPSRGSMVATSWRVREGGGAMALTPLRSGLIGLVGLLSVGTGVLQRSVTAE